MMMEATFKLRIRLMATTIASVERSCRQSPVTDSSNWRGRKLNILYLATNSYCVTNWDRLLNSSKPSNMPLTLLFEHRPKLPWHGLAFASSFPSS